jgi:hypothetical protein
MPDGEEVMSKDWEIVGRDILVTNRRVSGDHDMPVAIRLSSVTRWKKRLNQDCLVWFNDGKDPLVINIPFDQFTKIVSMPTVASLDD